MSPDEYGIRLAGDCAPLTDDQVEAAARILAGVETERVAA